MRCQILIWMKGFLPKSRSWLWKPAQVELTLAPSAMCMIQQGKKGPWLAN